MQCKLCVRVMNQQIHSVVLLMVLEKGSEIKTKRGFLVCEKYKLITFSFHLTSVKQKLEKQ